MSDRDEPRRPEARWPRWAVLTVGVLAAAGAGLRLAVTGGDYTGHLLGWLLVVLPVLLLARQAGAAGALFGAATGLTALLVAELAAGPLPGAEQAWTIFVGASAVYLAFALGTVAGLALRDRAWLARTAERSFLARLRGLLPGSGTFERAGERQHEGADGSGDVRSRLRELVLAAKDSGEPVAVVLFRLPGLPALPDDVQRAVLGAVEDQLGDRHVLTRDEPDRLVALLPGETSKGASVLAERVRANVAPLAPGDGPRLEFSAGVAAAGGGDPVASELLDHAGAALDQAMRLGGDRIMVRDGGAFREGPLRTAFEA